MASLYGHYYFTRQRIFPSVILERALPVILKMNVVLPFIMPFWYQPCYMFTYMFHKMKEKLILGKLEPRG